MIEYSWGSLRVRGEIIEWKKSEIIELLQYLLKNLIWAAHLVILRDYIY
jgi:hypothetical protein